MNPIWIVDAFAHAPYTGNPAAVMVVAEFPEQMQRIAAEMNLSETVFVKKINENHFHIRWFTPLVEVKLCGHATMAAAHILFQEKLVTKNEITFDSLSGPLTVTQKESTIILNFPLQQIGQTLAKATFDTLLDLPSQIHEVVQAYDDVIVALHDEQTLRNLQPHFDKVKQIEARGLIVTAPSKQYDFVSRFFAPRVGVNEDPVTGSAHCKLADYWAKRLGKNTFHAYQASHRGGELRIQVENNRVFLQGQAITIMQGQWLV
ncbi:PhzF family phenazine biosynthesis isomerase [Candidatus Berkiella aquae]|uniref:PhzF family phenazine biosynthesis protein n=1 Tax=Candidatus Berkiella aquae TaxID=295108 RepID=A0A0Q9YK10_9GAMM|nr:PhzF family phenazine biosynthesis protein [Candidatus Berkiella aquae]MCS5710027.1 PhzF family phenazine biosynthesis protein [Candidatus Berkiella aquae]